MALSRTTQWRFKIFAGILSIVQALAWVIMSAIAIGLYNSSTIEDIDHVKTFAKTIEFYIYGIFIKDDYDLTLYNPVLVPHIFHVLMWLYLIFNASWIGVSFTLFVKINDYQAHWPLNLWTFVAIINVVWDLVMVIILGADYQKCLNYYQNNNPDNVANIISGQEYCTNGIFPVLLIAVKGFLLFIINIILIGIALTIAGSKPKEASDKPVFPPTYVNPQVPPPNDIIQRNSLPHPVSPYYPPNNHRLPVSPLYTSPKIQSPVPTVPVTPTRKWYVYSPSHNSSPNRNSFNVSNSPKVQNGRGLLSHHTQEPFVLDSPPRRY